MVGELIVTFCERGQDGPSRWLEVWAFPDGSLNLVIASSEQRESEEHVFPCAPHSLSAVVGGCDYQVSGPAGYVFLRRQGDKVVAEFRRSDDRQGWSQSIPAQEFADAVERSQPYGLYGYIA